MTDAEKLAKLTLLVNESGIPASADMLTACLDVAKARIINKAYPFGDGTETFPEKYDELHVRLAHYIFLRQGAEGETVHLENGISRHWEDGDVPATLLREITPAGGAL